MSIVNLDRTHPTARKQHICCDCGRIIEPGEKYERQANVLDGSAYTWKSCEQCQLVVDRIFATDQYAYDYDFGLEVGEWLHETESPLLPLYRAKWRDATGALASLASVAAVFDLVAGVSTGRREAS